jgi:nucleotidyltransferase/DNA polymerase involved in DNA repair
MYCLQRVPLTKHASAAREYHNQFVQVEEVRNPALRGKPVGVTQKYLIVTSNYEARRLGVTKLMGIQEAKEKVPALRLVCCIHLKVH